MICENVTRDANGVLCFGGANVNVLADKYGSPLYLMDEERIRANCRIYMDAMRKYFGESESEESVNDIIEKALNMYFSGTNLIL